MAMPKHKIQGINRGTVLTLEEPFQVNSQLRDGRRQLLSDCAEHAFARRGYYAATISDIVDEAGISRSTFYQYFDNKQHIFQSILDSFLLRLRDCIRPVILGPGAPAPLSQIRDNLTRVLTLVLEERDLSQILLHDSIGSEDAVEERVKEFYGQVADLIERSLKLGIGMNLVRPCNTRVTAYSMIGAVKEVVLQITSEGQTQPPVDELVQDLIEFGIRGLLTSSQAHLVEPAQRSGTRETVARSMGRA